MKFNIKQEQQLYPIRFNGKQYIEQDCNDLFIAYYQTRTALIDGMGVYISNGDWIDPVGNITEN